MMPEPLSKYPSSHWQELETNVLCELDGQVKQLAAVDEQVAHV
jgi:hypothetical protein